MARQVGDQVRVLGVAGRDERAPMRAFVDRHGLEHVRHLVDEDGSLWSHFGVPGQPAWVLLDAEGRLIERIFGEADPETLARRLAELAG